MADDHSSGLVHTKLHAKGVVHLSCTHESKTLVLSLLACPLFLHTEHVRLFIRSNVLCVKELLPIKLLPIKLLPIKLTHRTSAYQKAVGFVRVIQACSITFNPFQSITKLSQMSGRKPE